MYESYESKQASKKRRRRDLVRKKNEAIRKRNRRRIIFFSILTIFAIIGLVSVIGKISSSLGGKNDKSETSEEAIGGDVEETRKADKDEVREAMDEIPSKEGFTEKLQKVYITRTETELYTDNDETSSVREEIGPGEYVNFYGSEDGWYKISFKDEEGYAKAENFKEIEEKSSFKIVDGVFIVNKDFFLPRDYDPGMDSKAKQSLELMEADMKRDNMKLYLAHDYRSYQDQEELYAELVSEAGEDKASMDLAQEGHSEHQLGLAIDVTDKADKEINPDFAKTKEAEWLEENAYKYGFIIRYPKGKESRTGFNAKSWHLRYLGPETAKKIYKSGLSLEEYYDL